MIVADECVADPIVVALRGAGFEVLAIAEEAPSIADEGVLQRAVQRDALLVTADKDFGELVFRQRLVSSGVLLIRLPPTMDLEEQSNRVVAVVQQKGLERLKRSFTVLSEAHTRLRQRPHGAG